MIDVIHEIEAVQREVGKAALPAGPADVVTLRRTYPAPIEDVWDALTNPDRIGRWFLPISGDYRIGGTYQFEGNAGGRILSCDRPNQLKVTWEYAGGEPSHVIVRLTPASAGATTLELEHIAIAPEEMAHEYGPGAVGVGWEGGLLGLGLHLTGATLDTDPMLWPWTDEGKDFNTRSAQAWGAASRAAGADEETVARNIAATTAFYVPAGDAPEAPEG